MNKKNYDYKFEDIIKSLLACNIKSGDNVYISGNLFNFGLCKANSFNKIPSMRKTRTSKIFFKIISKLLNMFGIKFT